MSQPSPLSSAGMSSAAPPLSASLQAKVDADRARIMQEHAPVALAGSLVLTVGLTWMLMHLVGSATALTWAGIKLAALLPRLAHLIGSRRRAQPLAPAVFFRQMRALVLIDGLAWGAAAWYFTPALNLDGAVVTLACLLGLAAMVSYSLAADFRTMALYLVPILLPNVPYCLTRPDIMGTFGAIALSGFLVMLLVQGARIQRRLQELLSLRFINEEIAQQREAALHTARMHSEARSRFLATVSHEMRTPLHGMLGLTRLLQQDDPRTDQTERLRLIERSGEHLLLVINDVLDFSRLEAGRMQIQARPTDLTRVLQDVEGVFQVLARRKQLALSLTTSWDGSLHAVADAGRIRQVLHNLLGNAIKFTERGSIHLHARRHDDGRVDFIVRDTGPGIAEADRVRIFEAFTQGEVGLVRQTGGTGLGLSIARQLCQAMGGDLVCDSIEGMGSTFTATVVCTDVAVHPDIDLSTPVPTTADSGWMNFGTRVLLVEDNPVNVLVAEAMLRNLGYEVSTANDGLQAVQWLERHPCDVVLMDCAMPVMDGYDATREIRSREQLTGRSRVPIVALTAHMQAEEREHCRQAGMDDFVSKPFQSDEIQRVVERCVASGSLLRTF